MRLFAGFCRVHLYQPLLYGKVLDGEQTIEFQSPRIESMQNGMTSTISCCCAAVSLAPLAKLQALTTKHADRFSLWG